MALTRRTFAAATAAGVIVPTVARAKECPATGMDLICGIGEGQRTRRFSD
jgi:hypothetical protein